MFNLNNKERRKLFKHYHNKLDLHTMELAPLLGVCERTIRSIENGETQVKNMHLLAMEQLLLLKKQGGLVKHKIAA